MESNLNEEWRVIINFPGYEVSSRGRIRSYWTKKRRKKGLGYDNFISQETIKYLKPFITGDGYYSVCLFGKFYKVHRLVLIAFYGPPPKNHICRHLDGNKHNNDHTNLKWGTYKENYADSVKHGTRPLNRGMTHHASKLTEIDVLKIRQLHQDGLSLRTLAKMFNVAHSTIYYAASKIKWKHI